MAKDRGDQPSDNDNSSSPTTGQDSHESEFGQQQVPSSSNTTPARSGAKDGMSGQPIGGNDSNSGTGTTLTQGADFGGQTASGQAPESDPEARNGNRDSSMGNTESPDAQNRGFIGSRGKQGRGALDDQENEPDADPSRAAPERSDSSGGSD